MSFLKVKMETFQKLFFVGLFFLGGLTGLWAFPMENVTSDSDLYQQVRQLGDYGLLDPVDKSVLDRGLVVTRLELALYTEKAQSRLDAATPVPVSLVAPPVSVCSA